MFRASSCSYSRCLRYNCIYAASGIVTLCKFFVVKSFVFNVRLEILSVKYFYTLQPKSDIHFQIFILAVHSRQTVKIKHTLQACKHLITTLLDCSFKDSSRSSLLLKLQYSPRRVTFDRNSKASIVLNTLPSGHAEMRDYCPMRC